MTKARAIALERPANADVGAASVAFDPPNRIQTNVLASRERQLLDALCRRMPAWVTPDRLTALGSAGAAIAAIGYIASNWRPAFLFVSSLGIVVNWFGDSLDGSLARHRGIERPRYGYFLDHSMDSLDLLVFAIGLGLSPYVSMSASLLLLSSYYLLTQYVLLSAQVLGNLALTKVYLGPTELRLIAIVFNSAIFAIGPYDVRFAGAEISIYSALVMIEAIAFIAVFAIETFATARRLGRQDASCRPVA